MAAFSDQRVSRRDVLRAFAVAGGLAVLPPLLPRPLPARAAAAVVVGAQGRPDWGTAAEPYRGRTVNGMATTADWSKTQASLAAEFGELTGITVKMEHVPEGDTYWAKLQTELVGRSGAFDFVAVDSINLSNYARAGAFEVLESYLDNPAMPDYELSDYPDNIIDLLARREGKIVGLPAGGAAQIMFYRKDLLEAAGVEPPADWPALYQAAKKLRQGDVWGASWELKGVYAAIRFGNALPPDLKWLDEKNRLSALRDPRTIATMEIWQRMYQEQLIPTDALANDLVASLTLFQTGKAAILPVSWPSLVASTEDPAKSQVAGRVGYAPVPGGAPNASGWTYSIPIDAREKEAAYLFLSWITGKEGCVKQIAQYGNFDAGFRRSVLTEDLKQQLAKRPFGASELAGLEALNRSLPAARFNPTVPEWSSVISTISPIFQKIVAGELSAADGLNQAADEGEKILREAGRITD